MSTDIALSVLSEVSSRGFERIRNTLNKSNVINLPSEYKLQKQLPIKILPIVFEYNTGTTLDGDGGATDCEIEKNHSGNDDKLQLLLGEGNMGPVVLPPAKLSDSDAMLDHIH
jgi:hypothetical protein